MDACAPLHPAAMRPKAPVSPRSMRRSSILSQLPGKRSERLIKIATVVLVCRVGRLLSNARGIRGSCGRKVPIERRGGDTKALRDLSEGDVGTGEHRLGGLDVVVRELRRTDSGATHAPCGGKTRLGALADQTALKFCQRT